MKKVLTLLMLVMLAFQFLKAEEISIAPGLNTLIDAMESASSGDVLLLEYGGAYPFDQPVSLDTKIFQIKATGDAKKTKPRIFPLANSESGNYPGSWTVNVDLTLENIHWHGAKLDGSNTIALETAAEGLNIKIDNCIFTKASIIRLFNWVNRLEVTNTLGYEALFNYSEGNGMDAREHAHKYIKIQNCTFSWNEILGLPNHWVYGSFNPDIMDTLIVDHCNIEAAARGSFQTRMVKYLQITNNIFVNANWIGAIDYEYAFPNNLSDMPYWDCWDAGNTATDVTRCGPQDFVMFEITGSQSIPNQEINVANNNVFWSDEIETVWDKHSMMHKPVIFNNEFGYLAEKNQVDSNDFYFEEKVEFGKIHQACDQTLDNIGKYLGTLTSVPLDERPRFWDWIGKRGSEDIPAPELDPGKSLIPIDEFDMSYSKESDSYTAADGYPVGDLNWFPCEKSRWKNGESTEGCENSSNNDIALVSAPEFDVMPNPFSDNFTIKYEVQNTGLVMCKLFSITGSQIKTVVNEIQSVGKQTIDLNTSDLHAGIYMLRLNAGGHIQTLKLVKQ